MICVSFPFTGEGMADQNITSNSTTPSTSQCPNVTTPTATQTPCPEIHTITTYVPFRLKFKWNEASPCEGQLYVDSHEHGGAKHLCSESHRLDSWSAVCKDRRCGHFKSIKNTSSKADGLMITENMTLISATQCRGQHIMCQGVCVCVCSPYTGVFLLMFLFLIRLHRQNNCNCACIYYAVHFE